MGVCMCVSVVRAYGVCVGGFMCGCGVGGWV